MCQGKHWTPAGGWGAAQASGEGTPEWVFRERAGPRPPLPAGGVSAMAGGQHVTSRKLGSASSGRRLAGKCLPLTP